MNWPARLASGAVIAEPVTLVVAHPDDETLWAGAALRRLRNATLIVLTDGAPEDMADARRLGIATRRAYAERRRAELDRALAALDFTGRLIRYEVTDKTAIEHLPAIAERLRGDLAGAACAITHPYEGGHPDHDAAALAVAIARPTATVEFACYARLRGRRVFGRFVDDPACPEQVRPLGEADQARVEAALAAHSSQAAVFGEWRPRVERWRAAPAYDFRRPPPGEGVLYDAFGWGITSAQWRATASAILPREAA